MTKPDKKADESKTLAEESRLEFLVGHYNDTYATHRAVHQERNQFFFYLLICFALFLLNTRNSSLIQELLKWALKGQDAAFADSVVPYCSALLWVILVGVAVRYFQLCIQVERQYDYLHAMEKELNAYYPTGSKAFTREGASYLNDYPLFSNWMWCVYTVGLPVVLMVASALRIPIDASRFGLSYLGSTCFVSYLVIEMSCFSYMSRIHGFLGSKKESYWKTAITIQGVVFSLVFAVLSWLNPISP